MDLSKLNTQSASEQGAFMQLLHPGTGAPLVDEASGQPVGITLLGKDSVKVQKLVRDRAQRRLDQATALGDRIKINAEAVQADALDTLAAATIAFHHLKSNGEELKCSPESARKLYTDFAWIREQVDKFYSDRSNYLGN